MICKQTLRQKAILKLIGKLWEKYPQQRLGQLLENYVFYGGERGDKTSVRLFHQQDEETLDILLSKKGEKRWNEYGDPLPMSDAMRKKILAKGSLKSNELGKLFEEK